MNYIYGSIYRINITSQIILNGCSSANVCNSNMQLICSMKTFHGWLKWVLYMSESSTSIVVTSGHGLILILPMYMDIMYILA
jgi:hypothetical protein